MLRKLRLDVETLAVDSFTTADDTARPRGTVRAAQQPEPCTYWDTCDCPTAYYRCVEFFFTDYSCNYGSYVVDCTYTCP
jgi:hypothetical protein